MDLRYLADTAPLLTDLPSSGFEFLESIANEVAYRPGEVIFEQGETAESFFLVTEGRVALEVTRPAGDEIVVETIGQGELLGVSWLFPPHTWSWRARAQQMTVAVAFDAAIVRDRCTVDPEFAFPIHRNVAVEAVRRLHAARVRLLDLHWGMGGK